MVTAMENKSQYVAPNGDWLTTYKTSYKSNFTGHPPKRYNQPDVFENRDSKLPVREFPFMPLTPHRIRCYDIPVGPGLTTPDMKTWR